ncbi:MAG: hypothetical protein H5T68_03995 [Chloroflexi bacterium]|nr:hypothetical protein [Chloroflexota bacterium]
MEVGVHEAVGDGVTVRDGVFVISGVLEAVGDGVIVWVAVLVARGVPMGVGVKVKVELGVGDGVSVLSMGGSVGIVCPGEAWPGRAHEVFPNP